MAYNVNPMFRSSYRPSFATMGATDDVRIDSGDVLNLGDNLRALQRRLDALLQWGRSNPGGWKPIMSEFMQVQNAVSDLRTKYVTVYTALFGNPPAGLGIAPLVIGAALAFTIAALIAEVYMQSKKLTALETQAWANQQGAVNQAALIAQAQQLEPQSQRKAAAGDSAGALKDHEAAMALYAQAGVPAGTVAPGRPGDWSAWLQDNWLPIGLLVGAVVIVPKFLD